MLESEVHRALSENRECLRTQNHSGEPGASVAVGTFRVLPCPQETALGPGWTREQDAFLAFASHVPLLSGKS